MTADDDGVNGSVFDCEYYKMHYRTTKMTGQTGMKRLEIESFT